jgi:hypothetical protein
MNASPEQNAKETDPQTEDRCEAVLHQTVSPLGYFDNPGSVIMAPWHNYLMNRRLERDRARCFTRVAQASPTRWAILPAHN